MPLRRHRIGRAENEIDRAAGGIERLQEVAPEADHRLDRLPVGVGTAGREPANQRRRVALPHGPERGAQNAAQPGRRLPGQEERPDAPVDAIAAQHALKA